MARKFVALFLLVLQLQVFTPFAFAEKSLPLAKRIVAMLAHKDHKKTQSSINIAELSTDKTDFSYNSNKSLAPASNMKLITTAAALDMLGSDFTYETIFALRVNDLIVIGSGDPLTGDSRLAQRDNKSITAIFELVAEELKKRNLLEIKGDIVVDGFVFDDQRFHRD